MSTNRTLVIRGIAQLVLVALLMTAFCLPGRAQGPDWLLDLVSQSLRGELGNVASRVAGDPSTIAAYRDTMTWVSGGSGWSYYNPATGFWMGHAQAIAQPAQPTASLPMPWPPNTYAPGYAAFLGGAWRWIVNGAALWSSMFAPTYGLYQYGGAYDPAGSYVQ